MKLITSNRRMLTIPFAFLGLAAGLASFIDVSAYGNPLFKIVMHLAPLWTWGAGWLIVCMTAVIAVVTGRLIAYQITIALSLCFSSAWTMSILTGKLLYDYPLTYTAVGLWGFVLMMCVMHVAVKIQYLERVQWTPA